MVVCRSCSVGPPFIKSLHSLPWEGLSPSTAPLLEVTAHGQLRVLTSPSNPTPTFLTLSRMTISSDKGDCIYQELTTHEVLFQVSTWFNHLIPGTTSWGNCSHRL